MMDTTRPQNGKVIKKEGNKQKPAVPGATNVNAAGAAAPRDTAPRKPAATSPPRTGSGGVTPHAAQASKNKPANSGKGNQPTSLSQPVQRSTPESRNFSPDRGSTKSHSEALIPVVRAPGPVRFGIGTLDKDGNTLHYSSGTVDGILRAAAKRKRELIAARVEAQKAGKAKKARLPILSKPAT